MLKKDKPQEIEKIKNLLNEYSVIGLIDMKGLPGKQLQNIREQLRGKAVIRMSNKNLLKFALKSIDKDLSKIEERIKGEAALILSNENPFKLFKILKENRAPATAKAGQVPNKNIVAQKGSTGIAPGPAISAFQKLKIKTSVQAGKIAIINDTVVCKSGETVTADMVSLFSLLKLEPMEIGLSMILAWEDGIIYEKNVLDIDADEYVANIQRSVQECIALSVEIGWITKDTAHAAISKAFREAKELCLECSIIEKEFIDEVLMKAVREAKALEKAEMQEEQQEEKKEGEKK